MSWWDKHRGNTRLPHGEEDIQEGLCQGLDKKCSENQEKKANKTQEWSWQNFNPWRREQEQGSEVTERRKRQEGRTQRDFSSVRLNTGGNTGGNITWNARNHLKLFPEALLDFIRGLCQLAELPHSALDLGSVDPGGVQGLRDTDPKQHRVSRSQPWKHNSNTNPLS